jgi:ribosome-binding factor A
MADRGNCNPDIFHNFSQACREITKKGIFNTSPLSSVCKPIYWTVTDEAPASFRTCLRPVESCMSHSKPDDQPSKSPSPKAPAMNPAKFRRIAEEFREGDGIDPREEQKRRLASRRRAKPDHAAERLGQEMKETLSVSLPDDSRLEGFAVGSVLSTGKGNCFVVQVYCTDPSRTFAPESIQKILQENKGNLRAEVAQGIHRKRVPELKFEVLPPGVSPGE